MGMGKDVHTAHEISHTAPPSVVLVDRKPDMRNFPISIMAEAASMINLVHEAKSTNYWSSAAVMSNVKKQKAKYKKKWAKIRRKQGR